MAITSSIASKLIPEVVLKRTRQAAGKVAAQEVEQVAGRDVGAEVARVTAGQARLRPGLVIEKFRRMSEDVLTFFRGSPQLFYADLKQAEPEAFTTGAKALLLGDLHLGNLGAVGRQGGKPFWGMVDVDEAAVAPVKVELKRMATSIHLVGQAHGLSKAEADDLVKRFAAAYHEGLGDLGQVGKDMPKVVDRFLDDVRGRSTKQWLAELAPDGQKFLRGEKVLDVSAGLKDEVVAAFQAYRAALPKDEAAQLAGYKVSDVISPIAGVSSLGRRRYRVLATSPKGEALVFELKEQLKPAIEAQLKQAAPKSQAGRAIAAAEALNGGRVPFMGQTQLSAEAGGDGSFLVRKLAPWHDSLDATKLGKDELQDLVEAAGLVVARGHAGGATLGHADAATIRAELGKKKALAEELAGFGRKYADQAKADHAAFKKAVALDPTLGSRVIATR